MNRRLTLCFSLSSLFLVVALPAGCGHSQTGGTLSPVDLKIAEVRPPALMVAQKVQRPLVILLQDDKLPPELEIRNLKNMRQKVISLQLFATRDIKQVFAQYFKTVMVVRPADKRPTGPHIVADVRVDSIGMTGGAYDRRIVMSWAFALRPSEAMAYLYSYAGESTVLNTGGPKDALERLLGQALMGLMKGYTDKEIQKKLLMLPTSSPAPKGPAPTQI
jgi:hypothetical protein